MKTKRLRVPVFVATVVLIVVSVFVSSASAYSASTNVILKGNIDVIKPADEDCMIDCDFPEFKGEDYAPDGWIDPACLVCAEYSESQDGYWDVYCILSTAAHCFIWSGGVWKIAGPCAIISAAGCWVRGAGSYCVSWVAPDHCPNPDSVDPFLDNNGVYFIQ